MQENSVQSKTRKGILPQLLPWHHPPSVVVLETVASRRLRAAAAYRRRNPIANRRLAARRIPIVLFVLLGNCQNTGANLKLGEIVVGMIAL